MPWLQLTIDSAPEQAERLSDLLSEAGAVAVTFQDAADQPLYEPPPGATPLWRHTRVVGLFESDADLAAVADRVKAALGHGILHWHADPLEDRDWTRVCMDDFKPLRFGQRLWICPSWHEAPDPDAANVLLDPGLAFGTGTHPTTALCLEWLDAHPPAGQQVIDYGCGSGILALAALKLGARHVWAVDNDPQALVATLDNARKNGVEQRITAVLPEQLPAVEADLLLANILANPLIQLADRFAQLTRPGGHIVLSGILAEQAQEVGAAYDRRFLMSAPALRDDWARLDGRRR